MIDCLLHEVSYREFDVGNYK